MPERLVFLHTSASHVAGFEQLIAEQAPGLNVAHLVMPGLLADARQEGITAALQGRVQQVLEGASRLGARVIMCTCSSIGELAEEAVLDGVMAMRIDRAMADRAVVTGKKILIVAALASTLEATRTLLESSAERMQAEVVLELYHLEGVWPLFERDIKAYHQAIAEQLQNMWQAFDVVVLAQASMAGAAAYCDLPIPVLSSPRLGVEAALKGLENS